MFVSVFAIQCGDTEDDIDIEMLYMQLENENSELRDRNEELTEILFNRNQTCHHFANKSFTDISVKTSSGLAEENLKQAFSSIAPGLVGIEECLLIAEDVYGVNCLIIAGIAMLESGGGNSVLAKRKNNLFGLGAYDGKAYRSAMSFDSYDECVFYLAELLSRKCGDSDTLRNVNLWYASDRRWADKVARRMDHIVDVGINNIKEIVGFANMIEGEADG